jgi:23S rRNA pseudouridine2605 synthase
MLEALGHPATRLRRTAYAGLDLRGIEPGAWRELTRDEVASLRKLVGL